MHYPKRSLGQNFLLDQNIARKMVGLIDPIPGDCILEIGPGHGALTRFLLMQGVNFWAVEKDWHLALELKRQWPNCNVIVQDVLKMDWMRWRQKQLKVIGNLPYNIASRIIVQLLVDLQDFSKLLFMVQDEVAKRLIARPKTKAYGRLSVIVQLLADPEYEFFLGPGVFRPRPKVNSAVVSLVSRNKLYSRDNLLRFMSFIGGCFQKRRKQLRKILKLKWTSAIDKWFTEQGLPLTSRPEGLAPEQLWSLFEMVS